jgi:hypothetical protein
MKRLLVVALVSLGCSANQPGGPATTTGTPAAGSATGGAPLHPACTAMRTKVQQLYRAEAQAREPKRVDEAVADNTTMVMNDCARAPDKVAACIASASTVKDLEARCLAPIDDEGTEGDHLAR